MSENKTEKDGGILGMRVGFVGLRQGVGLLELRGSVHELLQVSHVVVLIRTC